MLTKEQFSQLDSEGFSPEEIASFETRRQSESRQPTTPVQTTGIMAGLGGAWDALSKGYAKQEHPVVQALASSLMPIKQISTPKIGNVPSMTFPVPGYMAGGAFGQQPTTRAISSETSPIALASTVLGLMGTKDFTAEDINKGIEAFRVRPEPIPYQSGLAKKIDIAKIVKDEQAVARATQIDELGEGVQKAVNNTYGSLHDSIGAKDFDINPQSIDQVLLESNVPDRVLTMIDNTIGRVDTVEKAEQAMRIINDNKGLWDNPKVAWEGMRKAWKGVKSITRARIGATNPEVAQKLSEVDGIYHDELSPIIEKFESFTGKGIKGTGVPATEQIETIFHGGPGSASQRTELRQAPEKISKLGNYTQTPEFKADVEKLVTKASEIVKELNKARAIMTAKAATGITSATGGVMWALNKLLGKK